MIDINIGADVQCTDGPCGKATNVLVNPVNRAVTHIVIEDKKLPANNTRLVPVSNVINSDKDRVMLHCTVQEVAEMPVFEYTKYIQETPRGAATDLQSYYFFPFVLGAYSYDYKYQADNTTYSSVTGRNVPAGELTAASGMEIYATDGKIGKLDQLILHPDTGEITHLLMREGHLWGAKEISIPVSEVSSARGGMIRLNIDKEAVGNLPEVPVKRVDHLIADAAKESG